MIDKGSLAPLRFLALLLLLPLSAFAADPAQHPAPSIAHQDGRFALMVDGAPYFILGAQVNNSSGWPAALQAVWPNAERMHLNTIEVPVYWEQIEPRPGQFDFSDVDAILDQTREHHLHLILLWFGTWKNGKMHYAPEWVKEDTAKYPRMITPEGRPIDVLSPNSPANLDADSTAFAALMKHLRERDSTEHTVVMMQVENESGSLGAVRDFSPMAQKQFDSAVPQGLVAAMGKKPGTWQPGTWQQVFGDDADETFAAYSVARYIGQVAATGKKEFDIPMYVNNWLKSPRAYPIQTVPGEDYPSGGPTENMLGVWKEAAPGIDILAPDIYVANSGRYRDVMKQFERPDNPLFVPESLGFGMFPGSSGYARNVFYALGDGAIGFSPFGLDRARFPSASGAAFSASDGALSDAALELTTQADNYRLIGSMDRVVAAMEFAGKLKVAVEEPGIAQNEIDFPGWRALITYAPADVPGPRVASPTSRLHVGRILAAQIGPNEFLVAGMDARVDFLTPIRVGRLAGQKSMQYLRVEEGSYDGKTWKPTRIRNGDETDHGLVFPSAGAVLHVKVGTY